VGRNINTQQRVHSKAHSDSPQIVKLEDLKNVLTQALEVLVLVGVLVVD